MKNKKLLNIEQLEKLTTKRLLAYKNSLMKVHDDIDWEEKYNDSKVEELTKQSKEWQDCYNNVKLILSKRENV